MPSFEALFQSLGGGALTNVYLVFFFKFLLWFGLSAILVKLLTLLFRDRGR